MSAPRIILASLPSFFQKWSKLVEIWRSSDKNNFAQFFETRCIVVIWYSPGKILEGREGEQAHYLPHFITKVWICNCRRHRRWYFEYVRASPCWRHVAASICDYCQVSSVNSRPNDQSRVWLAKKLTTLWRTAAFSATQAFILSKYFNSALLTYRQTNTLQRTLRNKRKSEKRSNFLWPPYGVGQAIIFLPCGFFLSFYLFSSPNLSGHILDVYHTSTHGVALVRIHNGGLKCAVRGSLQVQDAKKSPKIAIWAPSHNFVGIYLRN